VGAENVRAFRVTSDLRQSGPWNSGPGDITGRVEEIPIVDATVPEQKDSYFAYSYMVFPFTEGCHDRNLRVLLYRPGYETVEIGEQVGWNLTGSNPPEGIVWREARTLAVQEKALERVVARKPLRWSVFDPGVLRFVSQEYTRLASTPLAEGPDKQKDRDRLLARALECAKAADQVEKAEAAAKTSGPGEGKPSADKTVSSAAQTPSTPATMPPARSNQ
jgi:hypothetical protein